MSTTPKTAGDAPAPIEHRDGVPVYRSGQAPTRLHTRTQWEAKRRKPKPDATPTAFVRYYNAHGGHRGGWTEVGMYARRDTVAMAPLSAAALARRTCTVCSKVKNAPVRSGVCESCRERKRARTCSYCGTVRSRPYPPNAWRRCRSCTAKIAAEQRQWKHRAALKQAATDRACPACSRRTATNATIAAWRAQNPDQTWRPLYHPACEAKTIKTLTSCPDCGTATATAEDIQAHTDGGRRKMAGFPRRVCEPCQQLRARQREAEEQAAQERSIAAARARIQWARDALADHDVRILDTETTGLEDDARIVELTIITAAGVVLFDSLINPGIPIPASATAIHGITTADVRAPGVPTFADVADQIAELIADHRVLIWNAAYDTARLHHELTLIKPDTAAASAWLGAARFEDAMIPYSDWIGEWSDYWEGNRYQRLGGGHRALSDCRTVITRLREMAADTTTAPIPAPAAPVHDQLTPA